MIHGNVTLDELMSRLLTAVETYQSQLVSEVREDEERVARDAVKREQDLAFEMSLVVSINHFRVNYWISIHWGSEYPLNTRNIWKPNFLKFGFQMVWYSNIQLCAMSYVLDRPFNSTYENKIAFICLVLKWLGNRYSNCILILDHLASNLFLDHLNTKLVGYSDTHCILWSKSVGLWMVCYSRHSLNTEPKGC